MTYYKNTPPEQLGAIAMVLEGGALHALIGQCTRDFNAPALRAMHGAGRFAIEAEHLFGYAGRDINEVPSSTRECLSVIDALSALTKKVSYGTEGDFDNGSPWGRQGCDIRQLTLPDEMRSVLRDIYVGVACDIDVLTAAKEKEMQARREEAEKRYESTASAFVSDDWEPSDNDSDGDDFDPYAIDFTVRDHTFVAMLSVACASNDVDLVKALLDTRTGAGWLSGKTRSPSTRCDEKVQYKGNTNEPLQLKPAGWALYCNSHEVLDHLASRGVSIVWEAAHLVLPGRGFEGSDAYSSLSAWGMFDLLGTSPSKAIAQQVFASMKMDGTRSIFTKRDIEMVVEHCCNASEWPHLVDIAREAGIFKASPQQALELGLKRKIPAVVGDVIEFAEFPVAEIFEGHACFPEAHPLAIVLGTADKEHWKTAKPTDEDRDACFNHVLLEMDRRGIIASALSFTRIAATSKDVVDLCLSGRFPRSMLTVAQTYMSIAADAPGMEMVDAKMRSSAVDSTGGPRCTVLQAAIARRSAMLAIEEMADSVSAGVHP